MTIVCLAINEKQLFRVKTFSGYDYFVTFIDDISRKVRIYTLKSKGNVLDIFKDFHVAFEREIEKLLKCLKSDNSDKYSSIDFDDYSSKHNIMHEKMVPYFLQPNGVAKKMIRTLTERGQSMLSLA